MVCFINNQLHCEAAQDNLATCSGFSQVFCVYVALKNEWNPLNAD